MLSKFFGKKTSNNNTCKDEIYMEHENLQYLESFHFKKHLKYLTKRLQNKSIILYGAGSYLEVIKKYYDLSGLNIIGIADKRFEKEGCTETEFLGYKAIKPNDIKEFHPDYVLVATKFFINITEDLMLNLLKGTDIKVRPLVKKSFFTLIKEII